MLPAKLIEARHQARRVLDNYDHERTRRLEGPTESYALDYAAPIVEALRMLYVLSAPTPREVVVEALGMIALAQPTHRLVGTDADLIADTVVAALADHGFSIDLANRGAK